MIEFSAVSSRLGCLAGAFLPIFQIRSLRAPPHAPLQQHSQQHSLGGISSIGPIIATPTHHTFIGAPYRNQQQQKPRATAAQRHHRLLRGARGNHGWRHRGFTGVPALFLLVLRCEGPPPPQEHIHHPVEQETVGQEMLFLYQKAAPAQEVEVEAYLEEEEPD